MEKKIVEAATLQKKKTTINKAKIKKTIKNTLCRPDSVFWPNVGEDQARVLEMALARYKVEIPEFRKPHWKELKSIPKDQRPKQPKIKKVEGLIFGIIESTESIKNNQCSAVLVESTVNPRAIIQPLIEACISNHVPVICINGLRKITSLNFGIPSSCLAIKTGFLQDLKNLIEEIAKLYKVPKPLEEKDKEIKMNIENTQSKLETEENTVQAQVTSLLSNVTYLYRTSKSTRVFNPSQEKQKTKKAFMGQDFIEFSDKTEQKSDSKAYKSMILKRITNNQNRTKRK